MTARFSRVMERGGNTVAFTRGAATQNVTVTVTKETTLVKFSTTPAPGYAAAEPMASMTVSIPNQEAEQFARAILTGIAHHKKAGS